jgi:hypothetical protein
MENKLMSSDVSKVINPNTTMLYIGGKAADYLTLDGNAHAAVFFKVASYVLTLGIFPLVAYVVTIPYYRLQSKYDTFLSQKANGTLDDAVWVANNIQRFGIRNEHSRGEIARNVSKQIAMNFNKFRKKVTLNEASDKWIKNFKLADYEIPSIVRTMAREMGSDTGIEFAETIKDYAVDDDMRSKMIVDIAWEGVVPRKELLNTEERIQVLINIVKSHHFGGEYLFSFIDKCLKDYELSKDQKMDVIKELIKDSGFFDYYPDLKNTSDLTMFDHQTCILLALDVYIEKRKSKDKPYFESLKTIIGQIKKLKLDKKHLAPILQKLLSIDLHSSEMGIIQKFMHEQEVLRAPTR